MATTITWSSSTSTTLASSINSDVVAVPAGDTTVSASLAVVGSGGSGVTGSFQIQGSNTGNPIGTDWVNIPSAFAAVEVASGVTTPYGIVVTNVGYAYVRLAWTAGTDTGGTATGSWNFSGSASAGSPTASIMPFGIPMTTFEPVTVNVQDSVTLSRVIITAVFNGAPAPEVIYDGENFQPVYATSASLVEAAVSGSNWTFSFYRNLGWFAPPTIWVYAFDSGGGLLAQSFQLSVQGLEI
jgi:hypothetical protein